MADLASRAAVTWRYLTAGAVRHAMPITGSAMGHSPTALCGTYGYPLGWLGTGSQAEYERVQALRECGRCARLLAPVKGGAR